MDWEGMSETLATFWVFSEKRKKKTLSSCIPPAALCRDDELSGGPQKDYIDGGSGEDTVLFAADDQLLNVETVI